MDQDEIRAEIERRKKRAIDLKLRETIWSLYKSHLRRYEERVEKDPEMIYPELRETLNTSGGRFEFRVGQIAYAVRYQEEDRETRSWGFDDGTTTTLIRLTLYVDKEIVFEFNVRKTVEDTPDMPIFHEYMREVTAFIEGPWVDHLPELLQKVKQHEKSIYQKRQAPRQEQQLREDMRRFGL